MVVSAFESIQQHFDAALYVMATNLMIFAKQDPPN